MMEMKQPRATGLFRLPGRPGALLLLLFALLAGFQARSAPAGALDGKRVLILTSYGAGRPGVEVLLDGFTAALERGGVSIDQVFTENLDLERAPDPAFRAHLAETIRMKYAARRIDVLYVLEQPALEFLLGDLRGFAREAPVIAVRANLPPQAELSGHRFVSQLVAYDVEGTVRRALELFPRTRRILFVSGSSASDRMVAAQAMDPWTSAVACENTGGLTLDQVRARIAEPAPGTVIVVLPFNRDGAGQTTVQMEVAFLVAASAQAPVFTLWDNVVGRGAVGGSVTNFRDVGRQAGQFALDLMAGRTALTVPVTALPSPASPKFDWAQIERWGGSPGHLPAGSLYINRPATLWHQYRTTVIVTALFLLGQSLLIAVLLVQRRIRHRLEAERRELESRLNQSQKLESLGSLAGGMAHDINNVLAAILSLASAHRQAMAAGDPLAKPLDTIASACIRGRDVVNRLLIFARKDLATLGPVDLNGVAREMIRLLEYTTLKRIRIITDLQEPLPAMEGDAAALGHALMNLFVNAVDAMPEGGDLTLATRTLPAGGLQLSVRDTGQGMSAEVLAKAVEPFFTTKPMGKGTGLGLAMVFGTVKAHKGELAFRSSPGAGTEVILTFPPGGEAGVPAPAEPEPLPVRPLRVLLVDDDELILESVAPMLRMLGHDVLTADSGQGALAQMEAGLEVDLVILDMNMPGLNGAQTLVRLKAFRPDQRVLMASGYSDGDMAPLLLAHSRVSSIQKPFDLKEISRKLALV